MEYYAHSTKRDDKSDWQLLRDHLTGSAIIAREFAEVFNVGDHAYVCALIHDLGKYQIEFQLRLEGKISQVEHATIGAQWAAKFYGEAGLYMALAIAGHHGHLSETVGDPGSNKPGTLESHLNRCFPEIVPELPLPEMPGELFFDLKYPGFSKAFYIRMLYSALCDADCLDTERFYDHKRYESRLRSPDMDKLAFRINRFYDNLEAEPTPINRARDEILHRCLRMSIKPPGFFSLTVPTGGGKTLSSLAFALHHAGMHDLRRVIYTMPYTSVIEQNADTFRSAVGSDAVLEHHSHFDMDFEIDSEDDIVSGDDRLAAENWDKPVVVTTNMEFFESLFSSQKKRCRKLHNIAKSVIILDEAQAIPAGYLKPFMAALRELVNRYGCSVVLCTATQPIPKEQKWRDLLAIEPDEIIDDPGQFSPAFDRVDVRIITRDVLHDDKLCARIISQKQVLCIVNTRKHAMLLSRDLEHTEGVYHLSTCMCAAHRRELMAVIRQRILSGMSCRVISTPLVEAGVDVDFPVVYRALAGLDSITQAAGRCNREGKQKEKGLLYVFRPESHGAFDRGWHLQTRQLFDQIVKNGNNSDILSIPSLDRYFSELYEQDKSGQLDKYDMMQSYEAAVDGIFKFPQWDRMVRLVDVNTYTVIVPWAVPKKRWNHLKQRMEGSPDVQLLRDLQPLTVQVTPWDFKAMQTAKKISSMGRFFWILSDRKLYSYRYGLKSSEDDGGLLDIYIT